MKRILKLYLHQHLEMILAVVFSCIGISGCLGLLEHNIDYFYLGLLYFFIFFTLMGIHFYKNMPLYASILSEVYSESDFLVAGSSPLAKTERERTKKIRRIYLEATRTLQKENKNYRLLINKWVHQMKTPLSVLNMLPQEGQNIPADIMVAEIDRMNDLLNQILHLLRIENIENDFIVERCCLAAIVKSAINEQKNYFIQNEVYPKMDIRPEIYVYTDKKWFSFAIQQLLNNAVKYSDAGETVTVRADTTGEKAVLEIRDSGSGILPEDLPRIYEFCYTGNNGRKKPGESSGLGLYIAKNILDFLGHDVHVDSTPDEGTVFKLCLNTDH